MNERSRAKNKTNSLFKKLITVIIKGLVHKESQFFRNRCEKKVCYKMP